jgi:hypothetical protein
MHIRIEVRKCMKLHTNSFCFDYENHKTSLSTFKTKHPHICNDLLDMLN